MKVNITYFKPNGKYYSSAEHELPDSFLTNGLYEAWDAVMQLSPAPGLISDGKDFIWLIEVPDHPHAHPTLQNTFEAVLADIKYRITQHDD